MSKALARALGTTPDFFGEGSGSPATVQESGGRFQVIVGDVLVAEAESVSRAMLLWGLALFV